MRKSVKIFIKCLIFNDLLFYAILYASFTQALRKLYASLKPLIFNALPNIKQVLDFQRFYGGAKQGMRLGWCFVITCFLQKCNKLQSHSKATPKTTPKPQTFDFQGFGVFLWSFWSDRDMYRKKRASCMQKSCQLTDWSVGGSDGQKGHFS